MRTTRRFVLPALALSTFLALAALGCGDDDGGGNNNTDPCAALDCGDHGTCNSATVECDCDTGYTGTQCDECDTDYVLVGTVCVAVECADSTDCDDGLACTGEESCAANGLCQQGFGVQCDTDQTCLEPDGACVDNVIADFDDLTLASESSWSGDATGVHDFASGDATFANYYDDEYGPYWEGFAYSNTTDVTTPDFSNQYSAITGGGATGSPNYAVGYLGFMGTVPEVRFTNTTAGYTVAGLYVTNTTYAFFTLRDGDAFAKPFGGPTGTDPDWFKLTITGVDSTDATTGPVELYLADYTSTDASGDYILDEWTWVDLTGLGDIVGLRFTLSSTDNGAWGMNTPAYFAIDSITRFE
ncbi:MAG: DUF4465 domain-containing protein [bacterium]